MKKCALFLVVLAAITVFGIALSEASSTATDPKYGDQITAFDKSHLDGVVHGVFFYNNTQNTALAVVLDADGNPSQLNLPPPLNNYSYFSLDVGFGYVWGSNDMITWPAITPAPPARVLDQIMTIDKSRLGGVVHSAVFFNRTQNTAMAVVLDANGNPSKLNLPPPMNSYSYFFIDEVSLLWASIDGINWDLVGPL